MLQVPANYQHCYAFHTQHSLMLLCSLLSLRASCCGHSCACAASRKYCLCQCPEGSRRDKVHPTQCTRELVAIMRKPHSATIQRAHTNTAGCDHSCCAAAAASAWHTGLCCFREHPLTRPAAVVSDPAPPTHAAAAQDQINL